MIFSMLDQRVSGPGAGSLGALRLLSRDLCASTAIETRLEELDKTIASFFLPVRLPLDAPVRIDFSDSLILGEVWKTETLAGGFRTHIAIAHVIPSISELSQRIQRTCNCALAGAAH
jgi:hypothetical protein